MAYVDYEGTYGKKPPGVLALSTDFIFYGDSSTLAARPISITHTAICVREVQPDLNIILPMCVSTVRLVTINLSAISWLDFPLAINTATSCSLAVRPPKACFAT